ncbi:hypothetical protein GPECTOR_56g408 [Gonium pectorale]|uniref:Uncharacterized protein n=1 Tax=Gonium pectorale TaxID=33097 RepID=A0A150G652_GONPE|nr:hypothetical protein GPECTOR_56g408 [Gonium pectorale]|eukprot:KXZ45311.1 hypothetical protein GPECTOR_56g408 [Gonium pectorale]
MPNPLYCGRLCINQSAVALHMLKHHKRKAQEVYNAPFVRYQGTAPEEAESIRIVVDQTPDDVLREINVCEVCFRESVLQEGKIALRVIVHESGLRHHKTQRLTVARSSCKDHNTLVDLLTVKGQLQGTSRGNGLDAYVSDPPLVKKRKDYDKLTPEEKDALQREGIKGEVMDLLYRLVNAVEMFGPARGTTFALRSVRDHASELASAMVDDGEPAWRAEVNEIMASARKRAELLETTAVGLEETLQTTLLPLLQAAEKLCADLTGIKARIDDAINVRHMSAKQIRLQAAYEAHQKVAWLYKGMAAVDSVMQAAKLQLKEQLPAEAAAAASKIAKRFAELPRPAETPGDRVVVTDCEDLKDEAVKDTTARLLAVLMKTADRGRVDSDATLPPTQQSPSRANPCPQVIGIVPPTEFEAEYNGEGGQGESRQ